MKWAKRGKKAFAIWMIAALVLSSFTFYPRQAAAEEDTRTATVVGDFQSELPGGGGDWDVASTVTKMTYMGEGLYTFTGTLPQGSYQYKIAIDGKWTESYGKGRYTKPGVTGDGNIEFTLTGETAVTFYYNDITKRIADSTYYKPVEPRLTGTLQSELGDPADSSPSAAGTLLTDADFDNIYERKVNLPKGDYTYQIYVPGASAAEDALYPAGPQDLKLPADVPVTFKYNANADSHAVSATFTVPTEPGKVTPVPAGSIRLHYQRADGDYDNWGLWVWADAAANSVNWPTGATPFSSKQKDSFGAYVDIPLKANAQKLSFLVIDKKGNKDGDNDNIFTINTPETNEIWFKQGLKSVTPYEPVDLAENTVRIHYSRTQGDEEGYGLWLWGDVATPSDGNKWPTAGTAFPEGNRDRYGLYVDVPLTTGAKEIGLIVMKPATGDKDGDNKAFTLLDKYNQLWVKQGDPNVYVSPFGEMAVNLSQAEALSLSKLQLTFTTTSGLTAAGLSSAVTVTDKDKKPIAVSKATIRSGTAVELDTAAFTFNQLPLQVTYNGKTVPASSGWRLLDSLYNYTGDDLGATYNDSSKSAQLKLWAPLASKVTAVFYDKANANTKVGEIDLTQGEKGVWSVTVNPSDLGTGVTDVRGYYYQYEVTNNGVMKKVLDPYAKSMAVFTVNTKGEAPEGVDTVGKAAIVDLDETNPDGFKAADIDGYEKREDAVIYEVHIRDFTSDAAIESSLDGERWGSYAAFAKKLDYLKSLGVTHIQLLPVMAWYYGDETQAGNREDDYSAQNNEYNWGYDPQSYFSPDGAYSQNPADPELRIKELKSLIDAVHEAGMGVILDVVYTHMAKADFLNDIVPNYYAFQDASGNFLGDFGNNLATSHLMAEKLMVDSVKYWFSEYKIDGMRFDMMGDATADAVQAAYNAAANINPNALFLGEGWDTFKGNKADPALEGKGATQKWMNQTDDVAVFSDEFRNELKSGYPEEGTTRFITGGTRSIETIMNNIKAQPSNVTEDDPGDIVNYIEAHDNLTLHDVIAKATKKDPTTNEPEIQQRIRLGNMLLFTSQGTAFMQAGQEYGRTKQWLASGTPEQKYDAFKDINGQTFGYFISDSYDSSDAINHFDWAKATDSTEYPVQTETVAYTAGLIKLRKSTDAFRLGDQALVNTNVKLIDSPEIKDNDLVIGYSSRSTDGTGIYYSFINGDSVSRTLSLPEDLTGGTVVVDDDQAGTAAIPANEQSGFTLTENSIELEPLTAVIIKLETSTDILKNLELDSDGYTLTVGDTHKSAVKAIYEAGSERNVTGSATYVSDKPEVASVSSSGIVKGLKGGTAVITVSYGGKSEAITVKVVRPALDNKRYLELTYTRPDQNYDDWNLWVWGTGATNDKINFTKFENGKASARIELSPNATLFGFLLRKGEDWNTALQDISDDREIPLPAGEPFIKVDVTSMVRNVAMKPGVTGPALNDGAAQFFYRDPELFRIGDLTPITDIKVKVDGHEYPMTYDPASEWYTYTLKNLSEGEHAYTYIITKDGETSEITDPKNTVNGKSAFEYRNRDTSVSLSAAVTPGAVTANENAVLKVNVASDQALPLREGYLDLTPIGGPAKAALDVELLQQTIAVKDSVTAGSKQIPVTLIDKYGNKYTTTAAVRVKSRVYTDSKLDFDWDEARIYFALTDRFADGDATNNSNVDKTQLEAYHGGDFQGMIDKLDYLKELGINTLWISPIVDNIDFNKGADFNGTQYAYHGYWAKDFTQLDEHLGDMATFKKLIDEAHDRGIKIMVDVVLNHVGYGLKESDTNPSVTAEDKARFDGMLRSDNVSTDQNVTQGELAGLPDLMTEKPEVRQAIIDWQTGWLDNARTTRGDTIDYFRVDTVKHVDSTTWKAFKNALTAIDPSFKLVGEYYGATVYGDGGMLQSGQMDSLLDFGFKKKAQAFTNGSINAVNAYLQEREALIDNTRMMAQFLSSHDEDGFLSEYVGGDEGKLKIAAALQITAKGQPVIYYGEELGQSGKTAGDLSQGKLSENRKDMPWDQLTAKAALHDHYQTLLNIRAKFSKVFSKGARTYLAGTDATGYLAFGKAYDGINVVTAINTKTEAVSAEIPVPFAAFSIVKDEYGGNTYTVPADRILKLQLPGRDNGGTVILSYVGMASVVTAPEPQTVKTEEAVTAEALKNIKDGKAYVELKTGTAMLPLNAGTLLGVSPLVLGMDGVEVTLPGELLAGIGASLSGAAAEGAQIRFEASPLTAGAASTLLSGLQDNTTAIQAVSNIYEFKLAVVKKDGSSLPVSALAKPVTLTFKLQGSPNASKLGAYYIGDSGKLTYVGGTLKDGTLIATVSHFSKYAALVVDKSFKDVPAAHWAAEAIQSLAAKQIVTGVTAAEFKPAGNVTRAEFAALLVRALGLPAQGQAAFADVKADAWYSAYVAAAVKSGIVGGRSADTFAPNAAITREEMAAMVIRALEVKLGKQPGITAADSGFADTASVSAWAAAYVNAAAALGLVEGRAGNVFAPQALMTRAESAQVVYKLLRQ